MTRSNKLINKRVARKIAANSNLVTHAKRELALIGMGPNSIDIDLLMRNNIIEMLTVFSSQGHSGFSASIFKSLFNRLIDWKPVAPLTLKDDEFGTKADKNQNKRMISIFRKQDESFSNVDDYIINANTIYNINNNTVNISKVNNNSYHTKAFFTIDNTGAYEDDNIYNKYKDYLTGQYLYNFTINLFGCKNDSGTYNIPDTIKLNAAEVRTTNDYITLVGINMTNMNSINLYYRYNIVEVPFLKDRLVKDVTEQDWIDAVNFVHNSIDSKL